MFIYIHFVFNFYSIPFYLIFFSSLIHIKEISLNINTKFNLNDAHFSFEKFANKIYAKKNCQKHTHVGGDNTRKIACINVEAPNKRFTVNTSNAGNRLMSKATEPNDFVLVKVVCVCMMYARVYRRWLTAYVASSPLINCTSVCSRECGRCAC